MENVLTLRCSVKNYHWGKLGLGSSVAKLYKSAFDDFKVDENLPYAEMWMGTHPSGPSVIPSRNNMALMEWITLNPNSLGPNIINNFGNSSGLPFLFKVLSVNKALSIQVHPDKPTAEKLHKEYKEHYPDDNHKPEMAIALTNFEVLCGFRPVTEIKTFLTEIPQLQKIIGQNIVDSFLKKEETSKEDIREIFTALMKSEAAYFQVHLQELIGDFQKDFYQNKLCKSVKRIFLRLNQEYPDDIGCFSIFFFNYLKLEPGQAIFLAANEPHAYLQGDCIECMACSDNVVRAGLTPKFKDINTLCNILSYKCRPAHENIFPSTPVKNDPYISIFKPPVEEFSIAQICIPDQDVTYSLEILQSVSILIVIEGKAVATFTESNNTKSLELRSGSVLFIISGCEVIIQVKLPDLLMFRAYC